MNKKKLLAFPYILWIGAFILIPLCFVLYYAFTNDLGGLTLRNIMKISDLENTKALMLSLILSLISTIICLFLAYPAAMILNNLKTKSSAFIVFIFILPMWMNGLLRTYAWQSILEKNGILNQILSVFNLPSLNLINTPTAIVIGMVYNYLPFMILPIYNSLDKIDTDVINAAKDLGANYFQTFCKVILPLSMPGVISGIIMVFIPALTTFAISDILGGSKILLIGNIIEQEFKQNTNWHIGSGLSIVLMIFVVISIIFTGFTETREGERKL